MAEYTREDFDALLAKLKRLEPPDMTDCLGLVVGYDEVCAERDAIKAELDALKAEMPKPGEAVRLILEVDAQNALGIAELCGELLAEKQHLTEERDTLAAELAALRAGLPRWRLQSSWIAERGQCWRLGYMGANGLEYNVWSVSRDHNTMLDSEVRSGDYASARKRAEALLGLPPCEVEGE